MNKHFCSYLVVISLDYFIISGFLHEHVRPDRDEYLTVFPDNILKGQESNFLKRERGDASYFEPGDVDTQDTPFDFLSVLLYPPALSNSPSISKNGKHTLQYKHPLTPHWRENPDEPLTSIDITEIATAYNCKLSQDQIIQYIHMNRLANRQRSEVLNTKLDKLEERLAVNSKLSGMHLKHQPNLRN